MESVFSIHNSIVSECALLGLKDLICWHLFSQLNQSLYRKRHMPLFLSATIHVMSYQLNPRSKPAGRKQ